MLKALYFPSTNVTSVDILKNGLLLWDNIQTIVPKRNWQPTRHRDKLLNQAVDLIVEPRVPSAAERKQAHGEVMELLNSPLGASLMLEGPPGYRNRGYLIYPDKFLANTWDVMTRGGYARWDARSSDYDVPPGIGLLMMSVLSDVCAGSQIQRVTDRVDAYGWLAEHHARILGRPYVKGLDISQVAPMSDRLVTVSLLSIDARGVPLRKLVDMRKREARRGGTDYGAMRRRLAKAVQEHAKRLGTDAKSQSDVRELERQFEIDLKQDLSDLKAELKLARTKALLTKEVAASIVLAAGGFAHPIAGLTVLGSNISAVGVIPLLKTAAEYRGSRREVLKRHTMSWLYLARKGRLTRQL